MNTKIKYTNDGKREFFIELRKRVNQYFKENNISKHANLNMKFKTVFMLALYFTPFILLLTGVVSTAWWVILLWVIMGFGMAGIGLSVMHDANHGSYSKNARVNKIIGHVLYFIGGDKINWKIQHNVLHHSYTNVEGVDEDFETGLMRLSPAQERKKFHALQAYYAPFLYALMTMNWSVVKDFFQVFKYKKNNLLATQGLTFRKALTLVIFNKVWYFALTLVLPMLLLDVSWYVVLIGYLLMHFICGLVLASIFQCAHILNETDFYEADAEGSLENNWAIHQMKTTANFAKNSRLFSWFVGGLNFQIEHHLFPNICHVHYRKISKIVEETAHEFSVPYHQHKTFLHALWSHFSFINRLGTGKYDQMLTRSVR